jgi:hypothetical protein
MLECDGDWKLAGEMQALVVREQVPWGLDVTAAVA